MNKGVIPYEVHERVQIALGHAEECNRSLESQLKIANMEIERWKAVARQENQARIAEENPR